MKEIMKSQLRKMILKTVLIAFILSPTNQAWSVAIVPAKEQKKAIIASENFIRPNDSNNRIELTDADPQKKEHKLSKKEFRKLLKAQEPDLLPETNIEWFFLLVSGVGLFIAILGGLGGFGWLIFAGGLITYLFYKLLKN